MNSFFQVEISSSDGTETQVVYEELSVLVTADTFEKVDAAVVLIELLLASVSVSSTKLNRKLPVCLFIIVHLHLRSESGCRCFFYKKFYVLGERVADFSKLYT